MIKKAILLSALFSVFAYAMPQVQEVKLFLHRPSINEEFCCFSNGFYTYTAGAIQNRFGFKRLRVRGYGKSFKTLY